MKNNDFVPYFGLEKEEMLQIISQKLAQKKRIKRVWTNGTDLVLLVDVSFKLKYQLTIVTATTILAITIKNSSQN